MRLNFANALAFLLLCMSFPSYADLVFTFNASDQSSRPGDGIQVEWIVTNTGNAQENNVSVEVPFPTLGINTCLLYTSDAADE